MVSQSTPGLMWKVYTLPPSVIPPLAAVGTTVAVSATGVVSVVQPAPLVAGVRTLG